MLRYQAVIADVITIQAYTNSIEICIGKGEDGSVIGVYSDDISDDSLVP